MEGPLTLLHDRFLLKVDGNCTLLRYESQVGLRGRLLGWLIARFYRPASTPEADAGPSGGDEGCYRGACPPQQGLPTATM